MIEWMAAAWKEQLPPGHKLVYLALCDRADDRRVCWPSMETTAAQCGMTVRAVRRIVADLEKRGLLQRSFRSGRTSHYIITPRTVQSSPDNTPDTTVLHPGPYSPEGADPTVRGGRTVRSSRTQIEPPSEPKKKKRGSQKSQDQNATPDQRQQALIEAARQNLRQMEKIYGSALSEIPRNKNAGI